MQHPRPSGRGAARVQYLVEPFSLTAHIGTGNSISSLSGFQYEVKK
jgi:hypothetical protein